MLFFWRRHLPPFSVYRSLLLVTILIAIGSQFVNVCPPFVICISIYLFYTMVAMLCFGIVVRLRTLLARRRLTLPCWVQVTTVDGPVDLKIPSGTQPGTTLVMAKRGVPRLGSASVRGDHQVCLPLRVGLLISTADLMFVSLVVHYWCNREMPAKGSCAYRLVIRCEQVGLHRGGSDGCWCSSYCCFSGAVKQIVITTGRCPAKVECVQAVHTVT